MNKHIFPMSPFGNKKWHAWSHYLNVCQEAVDSLQDYLNYFNPTYCIVNDTIYGSEGNIEPIKDQEVKKKILINDETKIIYFPCDLKLHFRQGVLNEDYDAYVCYLPSDKIEINAENFETLLEEKVIEKFPVSNVLFCIYWTHSGIQNTNDNVELQTRNAYKFIPKGEASLYLPQGHPGGLKFTLFLNGQSTLGMNLLFSLDTNPTRYIIDDAYRNWQWGVKTWSLDNISWDYATSQATPKIRDKVNRIWTNSYPLMHFLQIEQNKSTNEKNAVEVEQIIADTTFSTELTNIANHTAVRYNIITQNLDAEKIRNNFIKVVVI